MAIGAITGGVHQHRHSAPRVAAAWPHQVGVIPSRAQSFQHRGEADRLRAALDGGGSAVLRQVLSGMGGAGKTQLAADYARTAWDAGGLDVLVWVTADGRSPIVTGYAQAGIELCRAAPDDLEQAARTFLAWLTPKSGVPPCRWLIVLDDVADPADLHGLWPPDSPHGRILVTTRRRDAALTGECRSRVEVGLFSEAEAVAYLTSSLAVHGRAEPADQLTAMAADLGHLALALAQAAAYLVDSGESAAVYRELLADRVTPLTDLAPDALPDEQTLALAAVWSLSITRADTLRPVGLARPLLHLASLLDANGIPQGLLTGEVARVHLAAHRTATSPGLAEEPAPVSRPEAVRALRALDRLSLIDHRPSTPHQAVRVHQLIQRATRDTLTCGQRDHYARTAADALIAAWPDIECDTSLVQVLRANAVALTRHAGQALYRPDAHEMLYCLGSSLGEAGLAAAARDYFCHLTESLTAQLGADQWATFAARHSLACWRGMAGDPIGAVGEFTDLLPQMTRVLGTDHPLFLTTCHSLAYWRGEAGDPIGAVGEFTDLLPQMTRVLGPDHPLTLGARLLFAHCRGEAGDPAGAVGALADLLPQMTRIQGAHHPDVLGARGYLAYWQGKAGNPIDATAGFTELLKDRVRFLGPDHPHTFIARYEIARWRGEAGDPAGAVGALADLLPEVARVLGAEHPLALATCNGLGYWRGKAEANLHTAG
ncbi:NB-ARC domain-containing protein [Streptomyces sp. BH104]|uniref:NB-ARC domain-containing protein n=1 Tax=Streptomyces sp. BH104 TaxID=3410407 RepID=UPI003BB68251